MSIWRSISSSKYIFPPTSFAAIIRSASHVTQNTHRTAKLEGRTTTTLQRTILKSQQCYQCSTNSDVGNVRTPTKDALLKAAAPRTVSPGNRITVVGVGAVGMACAFSILTQNVSSELVLIDHAESKLVGEMLDLQHGSHFLRGAKIHASTDYKLSVGSRICIVTSGVRQVEGESRLDLLQRNADVLKTIIPPLVRYSPNAILLIVTNPVDILTYVAWKLSGLPKNRVIGSGTNLDSSRFRFLMSQKLDVSASSCYGWIIGEHGDSSVVVWSGINVATVNLLQLNPAIGGDNDSENWKMLHQQVVHSGEKIIQLKGYTSWAIGLSVSEIAGAILTNSGTIHAVSVRVKGIHGITSDVFLSLPAVLGETGVTDILNQPLTDEERGALQKTARYLHELQKGIVI